MARTDVTEADGGDAVMTEEAPRDLKDVLKDSIRVSVDEVGVLRKKLTIAVPRANVSEELDKEYKEIISEAIVPGFRRGRAPRRLVEKRFGGEIGSQVQTRLLSNAYLAAVEKQDLKVLGDPMVWVARKDKKSPDKPVNDELVDMATALQVLKLPDDGDFEFRCEVEVKPEFELPSLDGVEVEKPDIRISDDDLTEEINRIRAIRGHWAPVIDGSVEMEDLLVCDLVVSSDGQEVRKTENVPIAARPRQVEGVLLEDFGRKFKGAKVGDRRSFDVTLPDDYPIETYRGKKAVLEFTLNDIKRMQLPPLDQAFLEAQGFDSEKELRAFVRQRMENELEHVVRRGMRDQVRRFLLDKTRLDLPEGLSARQTDRAVLRKAIDLQRRGVPQAEIEKHADELRTSAREQAVTELKLFFILERIAETLEIEVTEEEINGQIAAIAQAYNRRFDRVRDELARGDGIEMLYVQIRDDKCIDRILEKARIVQTKVPKKEVEKPSRAGGAKPESAKDKKSDKAAAPKAEKKTTTRATKAGGEKPKTSRPGKKGG